MKIPKLARALLGHPPENTKDAPYATDLYLERRHRDSVNQLRKELSGALFHLRRHRFGERRLKYEQLIARGVVCKKPEFKATVVKPGGDNYKWIRQCEHLIWELATAETGQEVTEILSQWTPQAFARASDLPDPPSVA